MTPIGSSDRRVFGKIAALYDPLRSANETWYAMDVSDPKMSAELDLLRHLKQPEFQAGLLAAQRKRDESSALYDEYRRWFTRLEPYLTQDPQRTVAEALRLYTDDRSRDN